MERRCMVETWAGVVVVFWVIVYVYLVVDVHVLFLLFDWMLGSFWCCWHWRWEVTEASI